MKKMLVFGFLLLNVAYSQAMELTSIVIVPLVGKPYRGAISQEEAQFLIRMVGDKARFIVKVEHNRPCVDGRPGPHYDHKASLEYSAIIADLARREEQEVAQEPEVAEEADGGQSFF